MNTPRSTIIGGAGIWTPSAAILGGASKTFNQLIKSIFSNGGQGFFYDPNDFSTMFRDAAGTEPVTGAGLPVGLILDKSKGLELGEEKITNGNFENNTTGWFQINGIDETVSNGFLNFTNAVASNPNALQPNVISPSKWYKVSFRVANRVAGAVFLMAYAADPSNATQTPQMSSDGVFTAILRAPSDATGAFGVRITANSTLSVTDISVKELKGNHAYQTTSASRPILRQNAITGAYYLEFDGSDDFLVTSNIDFTATDEVRLFAGVRKLSDAAAGILVELSANTQINNGTFYITAPNGSGPSFATGSKGTSWSVTLKASGEVAPISRVVSTYASISTPLNLLRLDGAVVSTSNLTQGTGNYGNHPLYIGRRGGASLPFNGHIYSLIGVGRLTTESETTSIEKELAKRTGVTLSV